MADTNWDMFLSPNHVLTLSFCVALFVFPSFWCLFLVEPLVFYSRWLNGSKKCVAVNVKGVLQLLCNTVEIDSGHK